MLGSWRRGSSLCLLRTGKIVSNEICPYQYEHYQRRPGIQFKNLFLFPDILDYFSQLKLIELWLVILKNIIHFWIAANMKKYKATFENEFLLQFALIKPCKNGGITTDIPLPPYTYSFPGLWHCSV